MKKIIIAALLPCLAAALLCGCARIGYGAVIIDADADGLINSGFYESHRLSGAYYGGDYAKEDGLPATRTFIIKTREEYDAVFAPGTDPDADLENEMLIVYSFVSINRREIKLKSAYDSEGVLKIELKVIRPWFTGADTCVPYQRYVVIKLKKADITAAEITRTD